MVLVSIIALLVIGPERLPETIRSIMLWIGRIRRTFTNIKTELEQEIGADEIRRQLHNETILKEIDESKNQIANAIKDADQSIEEFKTSVNESVDSVKATGQAGSDSSDQNSSSQNSSSQSSSDQKMDDQQTDKQNTAP